MALALVQTGSPDQALAVVRRGLEIFPEHPELEALRKTLDPSD